MKMRREIGPATVFAVSAGAMISSGLFLLPRYLFESAGSAMYLCYLIAAVLLIPAVFAKAELVSAMPKAGGDFYFIDRSLGPGFGCVGGMAAWASLALKSAFAVLGIGFLVEVVFLPGLGDWAAKGIACAFCILFAVVNIVGTRHAGRMQVGLVAALLLILFAYAGFGLAAPVGRPSAGMLLPAASNWTKVLAGAATVFIAFGGVTKSATLGEEVRDPRRDVVRGMLAACLVVSVLYVLTALVTVGLLSDATEWEKMPLSQAAEVMWGRPGFVLLAVAALFAFVTTGNAGVLASARIAMAMGQDGMLPKALGRISPKYGTPVFAIVCTSLFMMLALTALPLTLFVKAASAMKILLFLFGMVSLILMRESRIPTYNPTWRCPFYPWLPILGIGAYGFLLVELGTLPLAVAAVILGAAVFYYLLHVRVGEVRESALVRVALRLSRADFSEYDVEAELSRVVRDRDMAETDRFDHFADECLVLDLKDVPDRAELFAAVAHTLSPRVRMAEADIVRRLREREELGTTVMRPGLAVPHLIDADVGAPQMVVVRSRPGVVFEPDGEPVCAIFVLAASPEDREFYMEALVAVAEVAGQTEFDQRWLRARGPEALREIVRAGERHRGHGGDKSDDND
jgi:basic amino acid/polyamine antiporter, APA family